MSERSTARRPRVGSPCGDRTKVSRFPPYAEPRVPPFHHCDITTGDATGANSGARTAACSARHPTRPAGVAPQFEPLPLPLPLSTLSLSSERLPCDAPDGLLPPVLLLPSSWRARPIRSLSSP